MRLGLRKRVEMEARTREDRAERPVHVLGRRGLSGHTQLNYSPGPAGSNWAALLGLVSSQRPPIPLPLPPSTPADTPPCSLQFHPSSSSLSRPCLTQVEEGSR